MMMFLHGIAPQSEDKTNKGYFRMDIGKHRDYETLQKLWETLVFDCVTGNIPGLDEKDDGITGVRFIQKSNFTTLNTFRIEIWTKKGDESSAANKEIREYLENNLIKDVLNDGDSIAI
jgi:hypothetical protein